MMTGRRVTCINTENDQMGIMRSLCNLMNGFKSRTKKRGLYHSTSTAGVLQVGVEELGSSILECFGQSSKKHGEFRCV